MYLSVVRDVTFNMARISGLGAKDSDDVKLAVDEACTNIIKHAYGGDTKKDIKLQYCATRGTLEIVIEDSGCVCPEKIKGRDLDDVRPGGLGLHFIEKTFDVVKYDRSVKNGNRLKLVKHIKEKDEN